MKKLNEEFTYTLPYQADLNIKAYNEAMVAAFPEFPPLKTTEEHIEELKRQLVDSIFEAGKLNGWQFGDKVKITVNLEFKLENKKNFQ